jgi:hypothetical protein
MYRDLLRPSMMSDMRLGGEAKMIKEGRVASLTNSMNAHQLAEHGFNIPVYGYRGRVVMGPVLPVLDTTKAAAQWPDVDIGVNVRYNFHHDPRKNSTSVSFYTFADGVNMDFVQDEFDGGGRDHARGCQLEGIRRFPTHDIRELHERLM